MINFSFCGYCWVSYDLDCWLNFLGEVRFVIGELYEVLINVEGGVGFVMFNCFKVINLLN